MLRLRVTAHFAYLLIHYGPNSRFRSPSFIL